MKKLIDGTFCFLAAIIPMNIIFTVRFIVNYYTAMQWTEWVIFSFLCLLVVIGFVGHFALNTDSQARSKHQLGQTFTIKEVKDLTGEQYLTQFSLFILTAFAIPLTIPWIDFGFIVFVVFAICIVYVNCKLFYINPFLNIFGYKIYEAVFYNHKTTAETTFYVFTKLKAEQLKNVELQMKHSDSKIIRIKGKGVE